MITANINFDTHPIWAFSRLVMSTGEIQLKATDLPYFFQLKNRS